MGPLIRGTIPTLGIGLLVGRNNLTVERFSTTDCYAALDARAGVSSVYRSLFLNGSYLWAFRSQALDQFVQGVVADSSSDWVDLTGVSGTFKKDDALSIAGSVGFVSEVYPAYPNRIRAFFNDAKPHRGPLCGKFSAGPCHR